MEKARNQVKTLKEISVVIDNWDDIFSDFDPRPPGERVLSEDFILELKKRYRESRSGSFVITLNAPLSLRDEATEKKVVKQIKAHFRRVFLQRKKEVLRLRVRGGIFVTTGICSLGFLTLITYYRLFSNLAIELLSIVFMPLGWFGIWEGFSKLVDTSPAVIQEKKLFEKLANAAFKFKFYEEPKGLIRRFIH